MTQSLLERYYEKGILNDEQVARVQENVALMVKEAGGASTLLRDLALVTGGSIASSIIGMGVNKGWNAIREGSTHASDFKKMIEALRLMTDFGDRALTAQEMKKAEVAFNTYRTMDPTLSRDPFAAASFVHSALMSGTSSGGMQTFREFNRKDEGNRPLSYYAPSAIRLGDVSQIMDRNDPLHKLVDTQRAAESMEAFERRDRATGAHAATSATGAPSSQVAHMMKVMEQHAAKVK